MGPEERRFKVFNVSGSKVDTFAGVKSNEIHLFPPRLQQCTNCHGRSRPGVRSLGDFFHGDRFASKFTYEVGSPAKIAQATAEQKRGDQTWKRLQELWPIEASP